MSTIEEGSEVTLNLLEACFSPEQETLNLVRDATTAVLQKCAATDPYNPVCTAVKNLASQGKVSDTLGSRLELALDVARLSNNNEKLVQVVDGAVNIHNLHDFAVQFDTATIAKSIAPAGSGDPTPGQVAEAQSIRKAVFAEAPTPTVEGMLKAGKIKLGEKDEPVKTHVLHVLSMLDKQAIVQHAPMASNAAVSAIAAVPEEARPAVVRQIKVLGRTASLATTPDAAAALINHGLTTSLSVARIPKDEFILAVRDTMGAATASEVHANAVNVVIRNEKTLLGLLEMIKGTGLRAIDRAESPELQRLRVKKAAEASGLTDLNWEALFGSLDQRSSSHCTTVYSPASYFVELLQFLRASRVDGSGLGLLVDTTVEGQQPSIAGSVLEKLFRRRPDLGNLELTCENTNTVLPHIDLANEIMESFIANTPALVTQSADPRGRQLLVDAYNVGNEDSSELLSQPKNTNLTAYRRLAAATYPLSLPYHRPLDTQRALLDLLKVPRADLLKAFRQKPPPLVLGGMTEEEAMVVQHKLSRLHDAAHDRQLDAEIIGLSQEEYIILTGQAFFEREYFETVGRTALTQEQYKEKISVREVWAYWGYDSHESLASTDEKARTGLKFVKRQLLPRGNITYDDLVALVQTRFVNPHQPKGRNKKIFEDIRFSYKFLQTLVDWRETEIEKRLGKLARFLAQAKHAELLSQSSGSGLEPGSETEIEVDAASKTVSDWVFSDFEDLGKMIVLDSGEAPRLSVTGDVYVTFIHPANPVGGRRVRVGHLFEDGTLRDDSGVTVATVDLRCRILMGSAADEINIMDFYNAEKRLPTVIRIEHPNLTIRVVAGGFINVNDEEGMARPAEWLLSEGLGGGSSIDNVHLTHLDGTNLAEEEWGNVAKFIRLQQRLGWSAQELEMALMGLGVVDDASTDNGIGKAKALETLTTVPMISADTISQLAAIKTLLVMTGLPPEQLLTFWTSIPTRGPRSLYSRLFFGGNIRSTDPVFGPDAKGDYFSGPYRLISNNALVVQAAFGMTAAGMAYLLGSSSSSNSSVRLARPVPDVLNIDNLSAIYRMSLLAKILAVEVGDLGQVLVGAFGDPFSTPRDCLDLIQTWNDMTRSGFTWSQVRYIAEDIPSNLDPLAPSAASTLQTAKTLHDGLIAIRNEHEALKETDVVSDEVIRAKASLAFDNTTVSGILQLINGQTAYATRAPTVRNPKELNKVLQAASARKAKYVLGEKGRSSQLQVKGILSLEEVDLVQRLLDPETTTIFSTSEALLEPERYKAAMALSNEWAGSVARITKQPLNIFRDMLEGKLPPDLVKREVDGKDPVLLAPDVTEEAAATNLKPSTGGRTPNEKRVHFLRHFILFLQDRLSRTFMEDTITIVAGFNDRLVAQTMLENLTTITGSDKTKPPMTIMNSLLDSLKHPEVNSEGTWSGYITPATGDAYSFSVFRDTEPLPLVLNGKTLPFKIQQEDPQRLWTTISSPFRLSAGALHSLQLKGLRPDELQWRTASGSRVDIPSSALLPGRAEKHLRETLMGLQKLAMVTNTFNLTPGEVEYMNNHRGDFDDMDFLHLTIAHWQRLHRYVKLRNSLPPKTDITLLELFDWATNHQTAKPEDLTKMISAATSWDRGQTSQLLEGLSLQMISREGKDSVADFKNEANLFKLQQPIAISTSLAVDIPRLFSWALPPGTPPADFTHLHDVADDMQKVMRSRQSHKTWPSIIKPVNDAIRERQKNALISFLLVQPAIMALGITDADGLFEYFLIDMQMTPLVETSRIKQAIASVQVYVQRCLLGLEEDYGVTTSAVSRQRWAWMQKYRTWEANRKVFLYPENWIDPSLRDNKSELFRSLESALLQKDLTPDVVSGALRAFVHGVGDVSRLLVVGLCVDYTDPSRSLHVFARTRTAPYAFYHNTYANKRWVDWRKMSIEIPYYTSEDDSSGSSKTSASSGVYLAPYAFNGRIVVFIPQILRKTIEPATVEATKFSDLSGTAVNRLRSRTAWEIKLSWTERRDGTWTARKLCPDGILDDSQQGIAGYTFSPAAQVSSEIPTDETPSAIKIACKTSAGTLGEWHFRGGELSFATTATLPNMPGNYRLTFGYDTVTKEMRSFQAFMGTDIWYIEMGFTSPRAIEEVGMGSVIGWGPPGDRDVKLHHPRAGELLSASTATDAALTATIASWHGADDLKNLYGGVLATEGGSGWTFNELAQPFSLYSWELGLHAPMILIDRLLKSQLFEQALDVCHMVFDPMAKGDKTDMSRFWKFAPFKLLRAQTAEAFFQSLKPRGENAEVTDWRNNPFAPHAVARGRPMAYMKWMVMKYIEILVAYGDYYFRQNTQETIPSAIQMYVLASHLYGPRGQKNTEQRKVKTQTFNSLLNKLDAFSNAMVQMEEAFPFSNQTPLPVGKLPDDPEVELVNIFGSAATLYFTIPDNPTLHDLGQTIDDRLFKIRHSQDIGGVFRSLPLFEPPIDPVLLVQARAQGVSLSSVLSDLNGPMPNYRLQFLLARALELAGEVRQLGQALLSAREKQDAETYTILRARHDSASQSMVMSLKKIALDEANAALEALKAARRGPENRMRYYLQLVGEDMSVVPDAGAPGDFAALNEKIQKPVESGSLMLHPSEKAEADLTMAAHVVTSVVGYLETMAGAFNAMPSVGAHGTPLGCGAVVNWGPPNVGAGISAIGRGLSLGGAQLSYLAADAGRKAGYSRALSDRLQAANAAGFEIRAIDKQITTGRLRAALAAREIEVQQRAIDQAAEAEAYLRHKYTNAELYGWLAGQTRTLYYQTYSQAYDLAKKVDNAFRFERPQLASATYLQPGGYWSAGRDGLLAGEGLFHGLKQLEAAYVADRGWDYEVTKHVSLRQTDPMQLLYLRETGVTEFTVPEIFFDMDFPGHYQRRLKTVAVTIPCVVGPYASVNATLRLMSHKYRASPAVDGSYAEDAAGDPRFASTHVPITAIAVSGAQADAGVFELNFASDRYMPFEGAGAVSSWRLELPPRESRTFEYTSIADVVLTLRYTSLEGGAGLRTAATKAVAEFARRVEDETGGGLHGLFDVRNEFATGWAALAQGRGTLEMKALRERLPFFAVGRTKGSIVAIDVYLLIDGQLPEGDLVLVVDGVSDEQRLARKEGDWGGLEAYQLTGASLPLEDWTLKIPGGKVGIKRLWMLVRYVLTVR